MIAKEAELKKTKGVTGSVTLNARMVNSEAKPISVTVNRCEIVDVKVNRVRTGFFLARHRNEFTQHCEFDVIVVVVVVCVWLWCGVGWKIAEKNQGQNGKRKK